MPSQKHRYRDFGAGSFCFVIAFFSGACAFEDDERCGSGYNYEDYTCVPVDTGATDENDSSSDDSSGQDCVEEDTASSGLGTPCTVEGGECVDLEASYCAFNPMTQTGYCTFEGCTADPCTCPPSYTCCDMPFPNVPNFCAIQEDAEAMGNQCGKP